MGVCTSSRRVAVVDVSPAEPPHKEPTLVQPLSLPSAVMPQHTDTLSSVPAIDMTDYPNNTAVRGGAARAGP
jgi:hypothetical protein